MGRRPCDPDLANQKVTESLSHSDWLICKPITITHPSGLIGIISGMGTHPRWYSWSKSWDCCQKSPLLGWIGSRFKPRVGSSCGDLATIERPRMKPEIGKQSQETDRGGILVITLAPLNKAGPNLFWTSQLNYLINSFCLCLCFDFVLVGLGFLETATKRVLRDIIRPDLRMDMPSCGRGMIKVILHWMWEDPELQSWRLLIHFPWVRLQ